jgi:uncharacterized cupin superfamily protein
VNANTAVNAASLGLEHETVPPEQSIAGSPTTAVHTLTTIGGVEVGVWEMTPGTMSDVEADEVFVVLSGSATVAFADGSPEVNLRPGDVVRLTEGAHTVWTVTETLRKVYLTGA